MTWEMLREMDAHGIITGAHTAEHTVLTNQRLDDARRENRPVQGVAGEVAAEAGPAFRLLQTATTARGSRRR